MIIFNLYPGGPTTICSSLLVTDPETQSQQWTTEMASVSFAVVTSGSPVETACFMQKIAKAMNSMLFFV